MATLYVENIPKDRYEALRRTAKERGQSIAAEILSLLKSNYPTERELRKRREFLNYAKSMNARKSSRGNFPSTEEMIREDRER
jgi:plasmid stability protein